MNPCSGSTGRCVCYGKDPAANSTVSRYLLDLVAPCEEQCPCVIGSEWTRCLTQADLAPLHSEQKGLIDFLVLARAEHFVGFGPSTYSFFLKVR